MGEKANAIFIIQNIPIVVIWLALGIILQGPQRLNTEETIRGAGWGRNDGAKVAASMEGIAFILI